MKIEARLVIEKQELGKVYLTEGTDIEKNGGAGVAVRNFFLEIDKHPMTRIQENDFGFQVYVMLKQCQRLLTGFEAAMADGRIRGRKVLVGGGWGQLTARRTAGCCGDRFRPCVAFLRKCCGCGKGQAKGTNQVIDSPTVP